MDEPRDELLTLQEASALLGVAASTLRRWSDTGRVPTQRTLGGHRRFSRANILHLAHTNATDTQLVAVREQPAAQTWGVDERELARQEWHTRLVARPSSDRMRGLGQRLLGMLIQYINRREEDERFITEARSVGSTYGREAYDSGISMHDTIEAFLFFRSSFAQLAQAGVTQPMDVNDMFALQTRLDRFMDSVLLGAIAGYEQAHT